MSASKSEPEFPGTCPSCGSPVVYRGVGRRPIWCSTRCRNDAALRRLGARKGAIEVRIVQVPRTARGPLAGAGLDDEISARQPTSRRAAPPTPEQALWAIRNDADAVGALLSHINRRQLDGSLLMPQWLYVRNGIRLIAQDLGPDLERPAPWSSIHISAIG